MRSGTPTGTPRFEPIGASTPRSDVRFGTPRGGTPRFGSSGSDGEARASDGSAAGTASSTRGVSPVTPRVMIEGADGVAPAANRTPRPPGTPRAGGTPRSMLTPRGGSPATPRRYDGVMYAAAAAAPAGEGTPRQGTLVGTPRLGSFLDSLEQTSELSGRPRVDGPPPPTQPLSALAAVPKLGLALGSLKEGAAAPAPTVVPPIKIVPKTAAAPAVPSIGLGGAVAAPPRPGSATPLIPRLKLAPAVASTPAPPAVEPNPVKSGAGRASTPVQSKRGPAGGLSGIAKALDPKAPKFQLVLDNPNYGGDTFARNQILAC